MSPYQLERSLIFSHNHSQVMFNCDHHDLYCSLRKPFLIFSKHGESSVSQICISELLNSPHCNMGKGKHISWELIAIVFHISNFGGML